MPLHLSSASVSATSTPFSWYFPIQMMPFFGEKSIDFHIRFFDEGSTVYFKRNTVLDLQHGVSMPALLLCALERALT